MDSVDLDTARMWGGLCALVGGLLAGHFAVLVYPRARASLGSVGGFIGAWGFGAAAASGLVAAATLCFSSSVRAGGAPSVLDLSAIGIAAKAAVAGGAGLLIFALRRGQFDRR